RLDHAIQPSQILPKIQPAAAQVVEADKDLAQFCQFYDDRLKEEIAKAGDDLRKARKITGDFSPLVFAEIAGLQGARYEVGRLQVRFGIDKGEYAVSLDAIPALRQVLVEPARQTCAVSQRVVPEPCLARCDVSGVTVLSHLLLNSAESERCALPEYTTTC